MWIDAVAYFDKDKDSEYTNTLADLGLQDDMDLEEISNKLNIRIKIDAINEIVETRYEGVSQVTMESGMCYIIDMPFKALCDILDEYYTHGGNIG
jgi:hypothetical protein